MKNDGIRIAFSVTFAKKGDIYEEWKKPYIFEGRKGKIVVPPSSMGLFGRGAADGGLPSGRRLG